MKKHEIQFLLSPRNFSHFHSEFYHRWKWTKNVRQIEKKSFVEFKEETRTNSIQNVKCVYKTIEEKIEKTWNTRPQ